MSHETCGRLCACGAEQKDTMAELRRLAEAATPGPWEACRDSHAPENGKLASWVEMRSYALLPDPENSSCVVCDFPNESALAEENARLVAAMRNNLAKLLAVVEAAKEMRVSAASPAGDRFARQLKAIDRLDAALAALDGDEGQGGR